MPSSSQQALRGLTQAVWQAGGNDGQCPSDRYPTFRQLDDLITTTAWGLEAREEFFLRWQTLEPSSRQEAVSRSWPTWSGRRLWRKIPS